MNIRNTKIIISREYLNRVKKKSFLVTTFLVPVLFAALCIVPSLIMMGTKEEAKVVADTDVVVASSIWVVDADGTETRLDDREDALQISAECRGLYDEESIYWSRTNEDGTESYWAYYAPNEISKQSEEIYNAARGYKFVYKPDHKVTRVVFRMSDN